jgi:hypothetical protein
VVAAVLETRDGVKIAGVVIKRVIVDMMYLITRRYFTTHSRVNHPVKEH